MRASTAAVVVLLAGVSPIFGMVHQPRRGAGMVMPGAIPFDSTYHHAEDAREQAVQAGGFGGSRGVCDTAVPEVLTGWPDLVMRQDLLAAQKYVPMHTSANVVCLSELRGGSETWCVCVV